jgi:opacity protein-like surface antigen
MAGPQLAPATVGTKGSHTSTFTGWTASVGVEVATSAKTRLKFEYLYTDFGSSTASAGSIGSVAYVGKLKSNQIRIGINRSF